MKLLKSILLFGVLLVAAPDAANAAGCAEHASNIAARNNARVLAVSTFQQGGTTMCRITVLVPSQNGGPARKKTVVVRK